MASHNRLKMAEDLSVQSLQRLVQSACGLSVHRPEEIVGGTRMSGGASKVFKPFASEVSNENRGGDLNIMGHHDVVFLNAFGGG